MFYTYILLSYKDNKYYIGYTNDLKRRFAEHQSGKVIATKNRLPLKLIYYEAYTTSELARKQEILYKTGQGRRILKKRLQIG
ncbi:GIY-YIG nuclease family protein [Patescibacteria group bacterium]|nr:GIY-YIG nuclease family protein [Patescibacteria group bacterium]